MRIDENGHPQEIIKGLYPKFGAVAIVHGDCLRSDSESRSYTPGSMPLRSDSSGSLVPVQVADSKESSFTYESQPLLLVSIEAQVLLTCKDINHLYIPRNRRRQKKRRSRRHSTVS